MVRGVRALRIVLTIVLIGASGFVLGSGIAALPYMENDPCIGYGTETGPSVDWERSLVPYGTHCVMGGRTLERLAPSLPTAVAWWVATALLLAGALRLRRLASARGVALGLGVLGVFGLAGHEFSFVGGAFFAVVLAAPVWFVAAWRLQPDRSWPAPAVLAVALPFTTVFVWFAGSSSGYGQDELGVALALLAAAALAAAAERLPLKSVLSSPASPPPRA